VQQLVPTFERELTSVHRQVEEDLQVHFVIGAIHAGGVVDEIGVDTTARECVLDPASLGESEVAALGHHATPQVLPLDAHVVVHPVADVGVGFDGGLDVRADPAVPQQVHRRPEDGLDHFVGGQRLAVDAERPPGLGREGDALLRPGPHPTPV
jgi:hypothetical protein